MDFIEKRVMLCAPIFSFSIVVTFITENSNYLVILIPIPPYVDMFQKL